ncbi:hypothetical protein AUJ29_01585 [Candidatus Kuenenbacteria bacterium CG1_02_38_13]|uniref:Uncharacterized protein n=1 Tax=Candidatus Kuenenbacteria bacterium CG1_02_38_13 TaxID=1805235 RepID=A0A1J4U1U9_9BACT|nr:MAG: hypothetical protein AUJ29_01585 [Candidatus Kuenenbacteria bacterium CG1_02_38_13]
MNKKIEEYYNRKEDYGVNKLREKKINFLVDKDIKTGEKNILDVGCASGYISTNWRKGNHLIGLDIASKFAKLAQGALDEFYVLNLESNNWPQAVIQKRFDIILCAEVLEHLFAPQDFLLKLKDLLNKDGYIIITTPNFLVWNNRFRMFLGRYGAQELFNDYGHIHLFSYNSLQKLLHQVRLKIIGQDNLWYPNYLEKFAKILSPNLFVYQAILKVKPVK